MNELQIKAELTAGPIITNINELKDQLSFKMKEFKNAVFTEDSKPIAKAELAKLRKLKESAEKYRKDIKAQCMEPYKLFEKEIKELIAIIEEPIGLIDQQLKEMEETRIQKKREDIRALYVEVVGEASEYLPYDKIYDRKWELAGTSLKKIREALEELVVKTASELEIIQSSMSDVKAEALELYKKERDLTKALAYINTYEANKKRALEIEEEKQRREEERRRQEEIERARLEERRKIEETERIRREERERVKEEMALKKTEKTKNPFDIEDEGNLPFVQPTTVTAFYRVVATPQELEQVEMAFDSIGIYFERRDV